jgi:2-keto-4-pentenoate hydratase/2-oxohepta-3-ene-1,7-dioic acid hydratase in catechol pathway
VTKEEVGSAMDLKVEMRVSGQVRRQFSTASMSWPISRLIAFLSRMTLQPGDVI